MLTTCSRRWRSSLITLRKVVINYSYVGGLRDYPWCKLQPTPPQLSTKDFAEVLEALYPARSKWRNIGTQLKIDVHELDSIETEGGMSLDKKLDLMINRRLEMKEPCTWRNLYDALNHPTVAMSDVAKELPGIYCCMHWLVLSHCVHVN